MVWFYGISTIVSYLMPNPVYTYILDIYDLVWFYGISTIVSYLMPNPVYTYILDIYDLVWFYGISTIAGCLMPNQVICINYIHLIWLGWVLWHINHCRLFNAKSSLYIYIKYIWFGLVGFYSISTIVGYSMPHPLYIYIC